MQHPVHYRQSMRQRKLCLKVNKQQYACVCYKYSLSCLYLSYVYAFVNRVCIILIEKEYGKFWTHISWYKYKEPCHLDMCCKSKNPSITTSYQELTVLGIYTSGRLQILPKGTFCGIFLEVLHLVRGDCSVIQIKCTLFHQPNLVEVGGSQLPSS